MPNLLPEDLYKAEEQILCALKSSLSMNMSDRISIDIKLEGLRLLPVVLRFVRNIQQENIPTILLWPDAGATALAKRDGSDLSEMIFSFNDFLKKNVDGRLNKYLLIAVTPQPYDYDLFKSIHDNSQSKIVMINGKLDDAAVGIGSVARERRREFISKWQNIYWIEPLSNGALFHLYPDKWLLFRLDKDGYRIQKEFENKPSKDEIFETFLT